MPDVACSHSAPSAETRTEKFSVDLSLFCLLALFLTVMPPTCSVQPRSRVTVQLLASVPSPLASFLQNHAVVGSLFGLS